MAKRFVAKIGMAKECICFYSLSQGFCIKETDDYTPKGELTAYNFELDDENENPMWHIGFVENENQDNEKFYPLKDFVLLKTAGDYCIPWNASQEDLQADDWELAI